MKLGFSKFSKNPYGNTNLCFRFIFANGDNVGKEVRFSLWNQFSPNNQGQGDNCVEVKNGLWQDDLCLVKKNFFCEIAADEPNPFWSPCPENFTLANTVGSLSDIFVHFSSCLKL